MNLRKKKELAAKTLKIGKDRVVFLDSRKSEIKEAITKQDIRDLKQDGAILVKDVGGRRTNVKRKNRRGTGKIKKKVNTRKRDYVIMTRKLRGIVASMKERDLLSREEVKDIRNKIRNRIFKSAAHLKKYVQELRK
ncbi:MAG: 50S ribosomal protein L19e [Candidatus Pacearchaeota archaeon]|nr:50S ribosomal protein L19e [Candidatus Pacearchaeota archaeon]